MIKYGFAQKRIHIGNPPVDGGWKQVVAKKSNRSLVKGGIEYRLQGKWIRQLPIKSGERILGISLGLLCSFFSFGLAPVFSKRVLQLMTGRQVLRVFQQVVLEEPPVLPPPPPPRQPKPVVVPDPVVEPVIEPEPILPPPPPIEVVLLPPSEQEVLLFLQHCGAVVDGLFDPNHPVDAHELVRKEKAFIAENQEAFQRLAAVDEHWTTYRSVLALLMGDLSHAERVDFAEAIGNAVGEAFVKYPQTIEEFIVLLDGVDVLPWQLALAIEWRLIEGVEQELLVDLPIEKLTPLLNHMALHQEENLELPDENGNTMLHHAIGRGNTPFACLLISLGVSLTDKNARDCTPLDLLKDLPIESRQQIVQEILKREMVEKQEVAADPQEDNGLKAGLSKKIRLGKHLNKIDLWNKKWVQKKFGGRVIPEKWAKVGTLFDFTARIYRLHEEEMHFEEAKAHLNLEIKAAEDNAAGAENPLVKAENLKIVNQKQAALKRIEEELEVAKRKGILDVAEAAAPFSAQILRFIPRTADSVAKWMPGLSALTCGFSVYKGWGAIQEMEEKMKTMHLSLEQLNMELARIEQLCGYVIGDTLVDRILHFKREEIGTKMRFLERQIGQAGMRKQVEEWANWATWFKYVPMAVAYAYPPAGVAATVVGAVGFSTFAVDAYQYWENYGQMNESDFAPLMVADYEKRLPAMAMRLGKSSEQFKDELDAMMKHLQPHEEAFLNATLIPKDREVEDPAAMHRAGILNYILN
jgi:hypothetical protein